MNPLLWPFIIVYGVFVLLSSIDIETWLRLLAALVLLWHPWHEQREGFRREFEMAVWRSRPKPERKTLTAGTILSRRQNAVQATVLATVFPALALWGPWWALAGIGVFYSGDYLWTHWRQQIPGLWSAVLALLVTSDALWVARPEELDHARLIGAMLAGGLILALPWWTAYRKVRTS